MTNTQAEKYDNLAQKISGKETSILMALWEYIASFADRARCSDAILQAFQTTKNKALGALENSEKK